MLREELGGETERKHMVGIAEIVVSLGALCTGHKHSPELTEFGGEWWEFSAVLAGWVSSAGQEGMCSSVLSSVGCGAPELPHPPCSKLRQLRNLLLDSWSRSSALCLLRNLPAAPWRTIALFPLHPPRDKCPDSI